MAEGARLESVYTLIAYRGFESRPLRHNKKGLFLSPFLLSGMGGLIRTRWFDKSSGQTLWVAQRPRSGKAQGCVAANPALSAILELNKEETLAIVMYEAFKSSFKVLLLTLPPPYNPGLTCDCLKGP